MILILSQFSLENANSFTGRGGVSAGSTLSMRNSSSSGSSSHGVNNGAIANNREIDKIEEFELNEQLDILTDFSHEIAETNYTYNEPQKTADKGSLRLGIRKTLRSFADSKNEMKANEEAILQFNKMITFSLVNNLMTGKSAARFYLIRNDLKGTIEEAFPKFEIFSYPNNVNFYYTDFRGISSSQRDEFKKKINKKLKDIRENIEYLNSIDPGPMEIIVEEFNTLIADGKNKTIRVKVESNFIIGYSLKFLHSGLSGYFEEPLDIQVDPL